MPVPAQYQELAHLSPGIEAVWSYEVEPTATDPVAHVVLPDGCMDLILRHDAGSAGGECRLLIAGPSRSPHTVHIPPGTRYVGIRFNPAWGATCLNLEPQALIDQVKPANGASDLLGEKTATLTGLPLPQIAAHFRRRALELVAAARPDLRAVEAVRWLQASGGRMSPSEVARLLKVPARTLRRLITQSTGLSPAVLVRVVRFRRCLRLRTADSSLTLAALAHEAGYADQAHMTREFRILGGFSPARFPRLLVT
jgi:AraC-like DNA-binding protein